MRTLWFAAFAGLSMGGVALSCSGDDSSGANSTTGTGGAASTTGTGGAASTTGTGGAASTTGTGGAASTTGTGGAASTTGTGGAASTTGTGGASSGGAESTTGTGGASSGGASSGGADSGGAESTTGTGGASSSGASSGGAGSGGAGSGGDSGMGTESGGSSAATGGSAGELEPFSFFVTSLEAMQRLSGSADGFGGDLRYGTGDGLSGADKICAEIAESSMPGAAAKQWRAFLSVTSGPDGEPVHAKDRIGTGPWYDRLGRVLAMNLADLLHTRPAGADTNIVNDFPNEFGVPNHDANGDGQDEDNHDFLTGTGSSGELLADDKSFTCQDWTSALGSGGQPRCGHSWPSNPNAGSDGRDFLPGGDLAMGDMNSWISALDEAGCAPGINLIQEGGPDPNVPTVGSGGGYGGIYCFALSP